MKSTKMDLQTVRVNNYINYMEGRQFIDVPSKIFVIHEFLLGVNRIGVLDKTKYIIKAFSLIYTLILHGFVIYSISDAIRNINSISLLTSIKLFQFEIIAAFSLTYWKRLQLFFNELNNFDNKTQCRPKISEFSIKNILFCGVILLCYIPLLSKFAMPAVLPLHIITALENCFYGHLFNLLVIRVRLINYYMENVLSTVESKIKYSEFAFFKINNVPNMDALLDNYEMIAHAHKLLVDAVKWQLLTLIITSFVFFLLLSYLIVTEYVDGMIGHFGFMFRFMITILDLVPEFSTCMSCDHLHAEVVRFRELLSSSLFENNLDRTSRSTARVLLALTETRNLSFSLLRIVDISVSMPFSFLGLIITYLIILLQFKKVILPRSNETVTIN